MADKVRNQSEIEDVPVEKVESNTIISLKGADLEIDPVLEKKLLWKIDLNLIPITFLLFLCAFIDR